jgi:hypothetical protein
MASFSDITLTQIDTACRQKNLFSSTTRTQRSTSTLQSVKRRVQVSDTRHVQSTRTDDLAGSSQGIHLHGENMEADRHYAEFVQTATKNAALKGRKRFGADLNDAKEVSKKGVVLHGIKLQRAPKLYILCLS